MYYLSVLAILKNETMNLKMWLNHYLWQGVDHFYLIDNGSDDNPLSILQEYIDKGIVSYFYLPEQHKQLQHYRYVYDTIKLNTKWLTICDLDEFFFGLKHPLVNTIKTLETKYDYIVCNWKMFGSDSEEDFENSIEYGEIDSQRILGVIEAEIEDLFPGFEVSCIMYSGDEKANIMVKKGNDSLSFDLKVDVL